MREAGRATIPAAMVGLALVPLLLGGCGAKDDTTSPATSTTVPGGTPTVQMTDFDFEPTEIHIKAGETVTWVNDDQVEHWVVSLDPNVLDSGRMSKAQSFSHRFTQAGDYRYYCNIHNYMKGTVVVR